MGLLSTVLICKLCFHHLVVNTIERFQCLKIMVRLIVQMIHNVEKLSTVYVSVFVTQC